MDVPFASFDGRHCGHSGDAFRLSNTFIVREEKSTVLDNGAANRGSELVPLKRGDCGSIEEIPGVQCAVPEKFVYASVQAVGSRTGDGIDDASGSLAVLC